MQRTKNLGAKITTMAKRNKVARTVGDVVAVPLGDDSYGFGLVLAEPLMAFYDFKSDKVPPLRDVVAAPIAFSVWVMNYAVTDGVWSIVGHLPNDELPSMDPLFFKKDRISGKLTVYRGGNDVEVPATREQCSGLEAAAVWNPEHIADRLRDHFLGKPNKWVESMRP